ncbi:uncharacterized protein BXIN_2328 [Babesia sp. Xinjiang]|uniref:uncharacterized protein n=1 Tax=Babesia sp. Xinjiang TaxID=462227 RepID=UPI000A224AB7|nr:uncharacterized protein BXIN_2328 [Babesia sp. Xinjiang]ORM40792.1 hypothetical protein BXIN_2328 [Babesia sp. Xinjiang]
MLRVKESIRELLLDIQREEYDAVEQFNEQLNKLMVQLNGTLSELADKRREVLTDTNLLKATVKTKLTNVERRLAEMSLYELPGIIRPVDERYQQHGTPVWPNFWLYALLGCVVTRKRLSSLDRHMFGFLRDIRCNPIEGDDILDSFEIEFHFADNPFFLNKSLKRRFRLNEYEEEPSATPIEWKDTAENLADEVSSFISDFDGDNCGGGTASCGSFLDFFQPFKDEPNDIKIAITIRERIARDPLKYAMRYESARKGEEVEYTDTEEEEAPNHGDVGARYPFSWLF